MRRLLQAGLAVALGLAVAATAAQAAGFRFFDIPADADGPAIHGAMWTPCAQPAGEVVLSAMTLPGVKDCPIAGDKLPLVVVSHGHGGSFVGHHDIAETLADAGFVVAAINHPGDTATDMSRPEDIVELAERPTDIKRLVDFMLGPSPAAAHIDAQRVGVFGFSRGGYTGLALVGAEADWAPITARCQGATRPICDQVRAKAYPEHLTHDPRIKAAVIADPLMLLYTAGSFATVRVPVQLWASEEGGDGVEPHDVAMVDKNLPEPHEFRVVPRSAHFVFLAPCPADLAQKMPRICVDEGGFDRVAFHRQLDADVLAFFRKYLGGP